MKRLPLEGIRVADLTMVWAGPYGTRMLADMGAEVIKIESIRNYDLIRTFVNLPRGTERPYNKSAYFNHYNRNKLGVSLDLSKPRGVELFKELIKISDVVVENYRADVMEKLCLTYDVLKEIKQDIIMVSLPGHGKTGPERNNYAYGTLIEELSGMVSITGYPDADVQRSGISYGDPVAGAMAAAAVAVALHERQRTGKGQFVDMSQRETLTRLIGEAVMDWTMNRRTWALTGNRHPSMAPHGCYRCKGKDDWVTITVRTDKEWGNLCQVMGNPGWVKEARFGDSLSRWQHQDEMDKYIAEWTMQRTPYEVTHMLQAAGVAAGPVLDCKGLLEDPHLNGRGFWQTQTHPDAGTWKMEGPAWGLSKTPARIRMPAPGFGQHNDYLFRELLGLSPEEIEQLEKDEIIGSVPLIPDNLLIMRTQ
ncbi:MAG: CoA transferase [Chloroflexi bacterium]|nr:CoA transferase [Chloroflexota bacterium]